MLHVKQNANFTSETPSKNEKQKAFAKAAGFLTKLHAPKKELSVFKGVQLTCREKERCDVRGTFNNTETKFKGQTVWPIATNEKVFL